MLFCKELKLNNCVAQITVMYMTKTQAQMYRYNMTIRYYVSKRSNIITTSRKERLEFLTSVTHIYQLLHICYKYTFYAIIIRIRFFLDCFVSAFQFISYNNLLLPLHTNILYSYYIPIILSSNRYTNSNSNKIQLFCKSFKYK